MRLIGDSYIESDFYCVNWASKATIKRQGPVEPEYDNPVGRYGYYTKSAARKFRTLDAAYEFARSQIEKGRVLVYDIATFGLSGSFWGSIDDASTVALYEFHDPNNLDEIHGFTVGE